MKPIRILLNLLLIIAGSSWIVYPATADAGYWSTSPSMLQAEQEVQVGVLDGKIYVAGGMRSASKVDSTLQVYDATTRLWELKTPMPVKRHHATVVGCAGKVYVMGGFESGSWPWSNPSDMTLEYDPVTDTWAYMAPMPLALGEHSAAEFDGKIYVFAGHDEFLFDNYKSFVFDPVANDWDTAAWMTVPRYHAAAVRLDSLIYVVGGFNYGTNLVNACQGYSPASNTWYNFAVLPTPRASLSVAALDGKLYTIGGDGNQIYDNVEVYDPVSNSWSVAESMLTPRHGTGAITIGNTIFHPGGATVSSSYAPTTIMESFSLGSCVDPDQDGYGTPGEVGTCPDDNCPDIANPSQLDSDADGVGDLCDVCPNDPDDDIDQDGFCANEDNCPDIYNPLQEDANDNDIGDACDGCCGAFVSGQTGNTDCSDDGRRNLADITRLIDRVYVSKVDLCCEENGNTDGDTEAKINLSDITRLIDHVYVSKEETEVCL